MADAPDSAKRVLSSALGAGICLGLLAGLLAGWLVWPVRWHDTDPSDLRLEHQIDYVLATAESLASGGDVATAERRLRALTDEDTSWEQVANLVMRVAVLEDISGRTASGDRVRLLFDTLAMPDPNTQEWTPAQSGTARGAWVAVAGLGIVGLVCLWMAIREARGLQAGLAGGVADLARGVAGFVGHIARPRPRARTPAEVLHGGISRPAADDYTASGYAPPATPARPVGERRPLVIVEEPEGVEGERGEEEPAEDEWIEGEEEPEEEPEGLAAGGPIDREGEYPLALGVWEAEYRHGDPDFDCAFSIEDEEGRYLGECGVGVADVTDANGSAAVQAFEVWLFDKNDVRTVSTILVSEYAYRHDALSAEAGNKGDVELAQPGQVLTLETMHLQMTATVKAVSYTKGGPGPNSAFGALTVELVVEPADVE